MYMYPYVVDDSVCDCLFPAQAEFSLELCAF